MKRTNGTLVVAATMSILVALAGCNSKKPTSEPVKMGQLDAMKIAKRTDQFSTISSSTFLKDKADCSSDNRLIESLWQLNLRGLDRMGEPKLADWGMSPVKLKDGEGTLVVLRREFKPGDPGVISQADDIYLVNKSYQLILWNFAQDV
jgi:hypothetical protein